MGQRGFIRVVTEHDIYNFYIHNGGDFIQETAKKAIKACDRYHDYKYGFSEQLPLQMATIVLADNGRMWTGDVGTFPDNPWVLIDTENGVVEIYEARIDGPMYEEIFHDLIWTGPVSDFLKKECENNERLGWTV